MKEDIIIKRDRFVYRVAENLLREGAESVEIGNRVVSRLFICSKLKKAFPRRHIFTYYDDFKIEFLSSKSIAIGGRIDR